MSTEFLTRDWAASVVRATQQDPGFVRAARGLTGAVHLYDESSAVTIRFERGAAAEITVGGENKADVRLGGTRSGWATALAGARDLGAASDPALGGLVLEGDYIRLAGIAVALMRLWMAMRRVAGMTDLLLAPAGRDEAVRLPNASCGPLPSELLGRYVDVLGIRTYYESAGEGHPVVCIHSGGADGREYRHLLPHLSNLGYRAIALDMPGHGKSYPDLDTLRPIDTAEAWIDFVLAFSGRLGLDRPAYVGCAQSASLLLRLAGEHPDSSAAIVSAGGTADFVGWLSEEYLDALNHPQVNVSDFMESTTLGLVGPQSSLAVQNEARWHNARNLTPEVMAGDLRIYSTHDVKALLPLIRVPVLHLRGEFDRTVSDANAAAIRDGIPNVRMTRLLGVGHFSMVEDPGLFNAAVEQFLRDVLHALPVSSSLQR